MAVWWVVNLPRPAKVRLVLLILIDQMHDVADVGPGVFRLRHICVSTDSESVSYLAVPAYRPSAASDGAPSIISADVLFVDTAKIERVSASLGYIGRLNL